MTDSVAEKERSTALTTPPARNTVAGGVYGSDALRETLRRGVEQSYALWRRGGLESKERVVLMFISDLHFSGYHSSTGPTWSSSCQDMQGWGREEEFGRAFAVTGDLTEALDEINEIIRRKAELWTLERVEEEEPQVLIPDEYSVEGIQVDWKSTFRYHDRLNKLRKKYGIRCV